MGSFAWGWDPSSTWLIMERLYVWGKRFVTDDGDVGRFIDHPDGLGRTHTGNAIADNRVFHNTTPAVALPGRARTLEK
ncbi:hypothetical protein DSCOOX_35820 [Desulfosarcina ovata subsp. ovata]|uniref:Uncharacterized protein n=1 Tax=Desulfosarcina ovata subsp. ovata TaxID=2752305 RepID=A0A5K8ACL6_9BACT|nr:hypothetical protein DSCOOX_35820 [Desulfosarcina ovata subsp. ovata]